MQIRINSNLNWKESKCFISFYVFFYLHAYLFFHWDGMIMEAMKRMGGGSFVVKFSLVVECWGSYSRELYCNYFNYSEIFFLSDFMRFTSCYKDLKGICFEVVGSNLIWVRTCFLANSSPFVGLRGKWWGTTLKEVYFFCNYISSYTPYQF